MARPSLIIFDLQQEKNAPSSMRLKSVVDFFESEGISVCREVMPISFIKKLAILKRYLFKKEFIFISMPPFAIWPLLLLNNHLIIDWRDGWSIAMKTGYGGTTNAKLIKCALAQFVEKVYLRYAFRVITCTPGLVSYHSRLKKYDVTFLPNGHINSGVKAKKGELFLNKEILTVTCCGKFSEYGLAKAKLLVSTLRKRYSGNQKILLRLIGCDYVQNEWVLEYSNKFDIRVQFLPKLRYEEMLSELCKSDLAAVIIRDTDYDLGTKAFDAVSLGIPIVNIYEGSNFATYFSGCFDTDYDPMIVKEFALKHRRSYLVSYYLSDLASDLINQQ